MRLPIINLRQFHNSFIEGDRVFLFDFDGTLFLSKEATQRAYAAAGVQLRDEDWGKSAKDWGCPDWAHANKSRIWPGFVSGIQNSKLVQFYNSLASRYILTGASQYTWDVSSAVAIGNGMLPPTVVRVGMSLEEKVEALTSIFPTPFTYFDDSLTALNAMAFEIPKRSPVPYGVQLVHVNY